MQVGDRSQHLPRKLLHHGEREGSVVVRAQEVEEARSQALKYLIGRVKVSIMLWCIHRQSSEAATSGPTGQANRLEFLTMHT